MTMSEGYPPGSAEPRWRYATLTFARGSLVALALALFGGLLSAMYTAPTLAALLEPIGLDMRALRPLHTTFAAAFIFLGGIAVVHRYFQDVGGEVSAGDRLRVRIQVVTWALAGLGIFITVPLGITSGREYVGFHPFFSLLIMTGWICFTWNFLRVTAKGFWDRPIYVTMWGVGCLFFIYTFSEQHAYLLPGVFEDPIVDRRIQWKACGTLVGSMNLFVYGSLIYVGEKLSGDESYGHSTTAYALFGVGLLNSFTNFAHHTYHLPQTHISKWIAFVISMAEIIILFKTLIDIVAMVRMRKMRSEVCCASTFLSATKWWTGGMLITSLLIAVPPLNALIHGTYVVTGHAMGTMIGIDTMAILGATAFLLGEVLDRKGIDGDHCIRRSLSLRRLIIVLNVGVAAMIVWLHVVGVVDGVERYLAEPSTRAAAYRPLWLQSSTPLVLLATGTLSFVLFAELLRRWLPLIFLSYGPNRR
jgi:nitric oxide reductase subunit B